MCLYVFAMYNDVVWVILKHKCIKLIILLEPRQLKTKKKLSQLDVDEQKKQLQEVNAIIENGADFLPNDSSTGKHTCKFVTYLHYPIYIREY